jgi:hypothetical protein
MCGTDPAGRKSELCWTLANAFHCARLGGQPTLAEDDISLFAHLLQSDNVKVLVFVFVLRP